MFSGIIESVQPLLKVHQGLGPVVRFDLKKPNEFDDLKIGDSIAVNGICLTVETFDQGQVTFALAAETLKVLGETPETVHKLIGKFFNLERSMKFGDRIHGHLVTGHVDSLAKVVRSEPVGENLFLDVEVQASIAPFIWRKGSITLNGVSLTINEIVGHTVSVCLIPETLKRTNLASYKVGQCLNVEPDYFAKGLENFLSSQIYLATKK